MEKWRTGDTSGLGKAVSSSAFNIEMYENREGLLATVPRGPAAGDCVPAAFLKFLQVHCYIKEEGIKMKANVVSNPSIKVILFM